MAADRGLRARRRLRRPRAGGSGARRLVHVPPVPRARHGHARRAGGRPRFGFASYEAAETLNHLNLALVFTLPLAGLVVARYLRGGLSDRRFVALFALCVLGMFATFLETLFWATLGGAFALRAGIDVHARRASARCCSAASCCAAPRTPSRCVVAAPYLWVALRTPIRWASAGRASSSTSPT